MAQASGSADPRFFCHECSVEVRIDPQSKTCEICNGGFIEEMEARSAPAPNPPHRPRERHAAGPPAPPPAPPMDPAAAFAEMLTQGLLNPLRGMGGGVGGGLAGPASAPAPVHHGYNTRQASRQQAAPAPPASAAPDPHDQPGDDLHGVGPNLHIHFNPGGADAGPFQGIMNLVLQRLTNDLGGGGQFLQLHGNPGDYAWGTAGLDTIITQLFNQIDPGSAGAPPADEATIANLPEVTICKEDIDMGAQCAICLSDYELDQKVRKLPCAHLFHYDCIKKWLEMHGTCPVCRKDMNGRLPDSGDGGAAMDPPGAGTSVS